MALFNVVKILNFVENVFCVYRNHTTFKGKTKYLATLRVFIESTFIISFYGYDVLVQWNIYETESVESLVLFIFNFFFVFLIVVNSLAAIGLGYYHSKKYSELVRHLKSIQTLCEIDVTYKNITRKENKKFYFKFILLAAGMYAVSIVYLHSAFSQANTKETMLIILMELGFEHRLFLESIVFYEYIEIIYAPLKYLNGCLSTLIAELSDVYDWGGGGGGDMGQSRGELDRLAQISSLLAAACDRLQDCFGVQISLWLNTITYFYMVSMYEGICYLINNQNFLWGGNIWSFLATITLYISIELLILVAGQSVTNEAHLMNTKLAELHNLLVTRAEARECARAARALSRRVRAAPVRVRLHHARPVRAALLVDVVAVVVNYTIILLQFNHVV